jgi:lipid A 4'-phosphatase
MSLKQYGIALGLTTLFFFLFPGIDPAVSRWFFTPGYGFALAGMEPFAFIHQNLNWLMIAGLIATTGLFAYNLATGSDRLGLRTRGFVFVILALVLAPGVVANTVFKDHWGRARPVQTTAFGGLSKFTPAMVVSDQCERNCSFISGDPSVGFWLLSFALLLKRRRRAAAIGAIGAGAALGAMRIGQGGHFLSDVVFSGFFNCGVIWLLYELIMAPDGPAHVLAELRAFRDWLVDLVRRHAVSLGGRMRIGAVATMIAVVASTLLFDVPIGAWARSLDPNTIAFFNRVTQLGLSDGYLLATVTGFIALHVKAANTSDRTLADRLRSYSLTVLFLFLAVALSGIANDIVKVILGRFRPKAYFGDQAQYGLGFFGFHYADQSFPSGHAATIFALATGFTLLWPRWRYVYGAVAVLVGLSRVIVGAHWPSDVIGGAFFGIATTLIIERYLSSKGIALANALAGTAPWPKRADGRPMPDPSDAIEWLRQLRFKLVGSRSGRLP